MQPMLVFDADDTLWDEQGILQRFEARLACLLAPLPAPSFQARLAVIEQRNIPSLGYGVASYLFSVAETLAACKPPFAVAEKARRLVGELSSGLQTGGPPIIDGVVETLETLANGGFQLAVLTRGVEIEQRSKLARSGLAAYFSAFRVVPQKDVATYRDAARAFGADQLCMVGNSLRADVLPALAAGWHAIHVPAPTAWGHDAAEPPQHRRFRQTRSIREVAGLVQTTGFWC